MPLTQLEVDTCQSIERIATILADKTEKQDEEIAGLEKELKNISINLKQLTDAVRLLANRV